MPDGDVCYVFLSWGDIAESRYLRIYDEDEELGIGAATEIRG